VVDIEPVSWSLLMANAGESAVHAVAKPVQDEEGNGNQQPCPVPARQSVAGPGQQLGGEPHNREVVRIDPIRRMFRHPHQKAFFRDSKEAVLKARRLAKWSARWCFDVDLSVHVLSCKGLCDVAGLASIF